MGDRYYYRVFGGRLCSALAFPELVATEPGEADWTVDASAEAPPGIDARQVRGSDALDDGVTIVLMTTPGGGARLSYTDSGTFDISPDGKAITWYRCAAPEELVRMDLLSRVIAMSFHLRGMVSIHASAVEHEGGGIALVAPKFFGKSTLAMALCLGGARLITDDTLVVTPGSPVMCRPGVQSVRLRGEAATHLAPSVDTERYFRIRGDRVVTELSEESLVTTPVPLRAVYLLSPREGQTPGSAAATRRRLDTLSGGMSLLGHLKLGKLLERDGSQLEAVLRIAEQVPVYALELVRDLDRLPEVVATVLDWERRPEATPG